MVFDLASLNQRQTVGAKRNSNRAHSQSFFSQIIPLDLGIAATEFTDRDSDGIQITTCRDMKKISVARIPTLFDPGYWKDDSESTVVCKGQTAKLHSRNGGLQDEKQVSVSWKTNLFK